MCNYLYAYAMWIHWSIMFSSDPLENHMFMWRRCQQLWFACCNIDRIVRLNNKLSFKANILPVWYRGISSLLRRTNFHVKQYRRQKRFVGSFDKCKLTHIYKYVPILMTVLLISTSKVRFPGNYNFIDLLRLR